MAYRWIENLRCRVNLWVGVVLGLEPVQVRVATATLARLSSSALDSSNGANNLVIRQASARTFQIYGNSTSDYLAQITNVGGGRYDLEVGGNVTISGASVTMAALPTSDPVVAGRLWNNGGVVNVSSGS